MPLNSSQTWSITSFPDFGPSCKLKFKGWWPVNLVTYNAINQHHHCSPLFYTGWSIINTAYQGLYTYTLINYPNYKPQMRQTCMCAIYCSHPSANITMYLTCINTSLLYSGVGMQIARHACRILVLLHWTSYTQLLISVFMHVPDLISKPYLDRCLKENVGCCQRHLPPQNCIEGISNHDHIRNHCLMGMPCRLSRWMDLHFWI